MDNIRHLQNERVPETSAAVGKKTAQATNKTRVQVLAGWLLAFFLLAVGLAILGLVHAGWFYGPFGPNKAVSGLGILAGFFLVPFFGYLAARSVAELSPDPTQRFSNNHHLHDVTIITVGAVSILVATATEFAGLAVAQQDWPDFPQRGLWATLVCWLDGSGHWRLLMVTGAMYAISIVIPLCYGLYLGRRSK